MDQVIANPSFDLPSPYGVVPWVPILIKMDEGKFFSRVKIRNSGDEFYWEIINVYEPME
jgi:hypothetical protein